VNQGFVADSSVGVAWVVASQSSPATEDLLDEVASGTPFVVPVLWMFEVSNALFMLARRKRIRPEQSAYDRQAVVRLCPVVDEDGLRFAFTRITELAEKHGLPVYDATYLELALRRSLPLASRDADLNRAAKSAGVSILV